MKTTFFQFLLLFFAFVFSNCSKKKEAPGNTIVTLNTNQGFLTTMAPKGDGAIDSACIRMTAYWLTSFSQAAIDGGFVSSAEDYWLVANDGSNHWCFKNSENGKYLKIKDPISGGFNAGTTSQLSDSTKFIMNKDDKNRFYIESAMHRGYYLITIVGPTPPAHRSVDFKSSTKQMWYLRP